MPKLKIGRIILVCEKFKREDSCPICDFVYTITAPRIHYFNNWHRVGLYLDIVKECLRCYEDYLLISIGINWEKR